MIRVTYDEIHRIVCRIPRGRVATYGQIAELAGIPGQARRIGYALSALPKGTQVPWQRVVNAKGEISLRAKSGGETVQFKLLRSEGVVFEKDGKKESDRRDVMRRYKLVFEHDRAGRLIEAHEFEHLRIPRVRFEFAIVPP